MKRFINLLFIISALNCIGQNYSYEHARLLASIPRWAVSSIYSFEADSIYQISDYINPFYFEEDFNGDNKLDLALCIIEIKTHKKGILILHRDFNKSFIIGAGQIFGNGGDNFSWMDIWKVNRNLKVREFLTDEKTKKTVYRDFNLTNPALEVTKFESASGLIYWDGNSYIWVQIGD